MARQLTVEVASPQTALAGLSCSQPTLTVQLILLLALFARQSSDYLRKKNNDNICFPGAGLGLEWKCVPRHQGIPELR